MKWTWIIKIFTYKRFIVTLMQTNDQLWLHFKPAQVIFNSYTEKCAILCIFITTCKLNFESRFRVWGSFRFPCNRALIAIHFWTCYEKMKVYFPKWSSDCKLMNLSIVKFQLKFTFFDLLMFLSVANCSYEQTNN